MGEAKRRGTPEQRRAQAMMSQSDAARLVNSGAAPHYAFIADRSERGQKLLDELKNGPPELQARYSSQAVQLWLSSGMPYVLIWGTFGMSGGFTAIALDLEQLLAQAIPQAVERTTQKGGMCTFLPGVDDAVMDRVMGRIAELQPTSVVAT